MRQRPCLGSSRGHSTTFLSRQASAYSTCCSSLQSDVRLPSPRARTAPGSLISLLCMMAGPTSANPSQATRSRPTTSSSPQTSGSEPQFATRPSEPLCRYMFECDGAHARHGRRQDGHQGVYSAKKLIRVLWGGKFIEQSNLVQGTIFVEYTSPQRQSC